MNQSEAAKQILVRPYYHGPLGIITIVTIVLYYFELHFIFACIDLIVLFYYLLTGFARNLPFTWKFFLSMNGSALPSILEILGAWQLMAEIGGVVIISLHRLLAICYPLSKITAILDRCPRWILTVFHLSLCSPIVVPYLFEDPAYYYYESFSTVVMPYTNHHVHIQLFYFDSFCVLAVVTSIICYCCIFGHLIAYSRRRKNRYPSLTRNEGKTTMLAFALFCALLNEFLFVAASTVANAMRWASLQAILHAYFYLPNFILAIVNPWCFLITMSGQIRAAMSGRKQTTSSRTQK